MKITKRYGLILPIILLQVTANAWGMDNTNQEFENYLHLETAFTPKLPSLSKWPTKINHVGGYYENIILPKNNPALTAAFQNLIVLKAKSIEPIFSPETLERTEKLLLEQKKGTEIQQKVFGSMDLEQYIIRLYKNRPLFCYRTNMCFDRCSVYDDKTSQYTHGNNDGYQALLSVGKSSEESPYTLAELISTEERNLTPYYGIAGSTFFVNNGERGNNGKIHAHGTYEPHGILVGTVGSCYEKPGYLDCLDLQDEQENEDDVQITIHNKHDILNRSLIGKWFNPTKYKKAISVRIRDFLKCANEFGVKAECHVVGLGLGAWAIFNQNQEIIQIKSMFDVYKDILSQHEFNNIDTINFAWFNLSEDQQKAAGLTHGSTLNKTKIVFTQRNLSNPVAEGKLLVGMVAWDGSSYFTNEFYDSKGGTGDPDSGFASLSASLFNPQINPYFDENAKKANLKNNLTRKLLSSENENEDAKNLIIAQLTQLAQAKHQHYLKIREAEKIFEDAMKEQRIIEQKAATEEQAQVERKATEAELQKKQKEEDEKTANLLAEVEKDMTALEKERKAAAQKKEEKELDDSSDIVELLKMRKQKKQPKQAQEATEVPKNATNQTFIRRLFSYRVVQGTTALSIIATLCYFITTTEQKDVITSTLTHYWEKLSSYIPTSARFS